MHMNSAPHLLNEDREEFARILDEALRTAEDRPDDPMSGAGKHLNTEQLRTMALGASAAIAACATAEYQHYVQLRAELRAPATAPPGGPAAHGEEHDDPPGGDLDPATASTTGGATETTGAGLAAMIAVLVPLLAGIAALLFLLIGYVLRTVSPEKTAAQPLISVGWIFAALTAAGSLVAMGGLVITALRNGASSPHATAAGELDEALALARDAWRHALLERGLLPFLSEALAGPAPGPDRSPERYVPRHTSDSDSRIPTLGYSRPDFTSPDHGSHTSRPRYSSPDFTSPDYGGPEAGRE